MCQHGEIYKNTKGYPNVVYFVQVGGDRLLLSSPNDNTQEYERQAQIF